MDMMQLNTSILRMFKLLLTIVGVVHLMGCLFYFNSDLVVDSNQTWIYQGDFKDKPSTYNYFISIYWSTKTITTVGYGDIPLGVPSEYALAIFWMGFGASLYTYLVGSISQMIAKVDDKAFIIQSQIQTL